MDWLRQNRDEQSHGHGVAIRTGDVADLGSRIDPVCGMTVQAGQAAARLEYGGKLYLFCSPHCQHSGQPSDSYNTDPCVAG